MPNFHRWFEETGQWETKIFEKHDHTKFSFEVPFFSVQNNIDYKQNRLCTKNKCDEMCMHNHCCCGKALSIAYSECVPVALVIQHAMRMHHILLSVVACLSVPYFPHYPINGTIFRKELLNIKFLNLIFVVPSIMLYSSEISPKICNNCVFILRNGFTLHVLGDNLTHHQEYICCIWPQVSRLT